jgi:hypothetical protein
MLQVVRSRSTISARTRVMARVSMHIENICFRPFNPNVYPGLISLQVVSLTIPQGPGRCYARANYPTENPARNTPEEYPSKVKFGRRIVSP